MTAGAPRRIRTVKVRARGEDYRIVQVQGNLFVCSRAHGSCCCGWEEKGRAPDLDTRWAEEWERRKIRSRLHLTFSGCLGPCAAGNNALLHLLGRAIWLAGLNDAALVPVVYDWAEAMLAEGRVLPPPPALAGHVYERFAPAPAGSFVPLVEPEEDTSDGLERLDPVCLMDVEPATARHRAEYGGRLYLFCAPSCRRQFLADPTAFVETEA